MQGGERFYSISDYLKSEFGCKTIKLSLDAGFTCPNRDGSKGTGGCAFCSEGGSGELAVHLNETNFSNMSESISEQIERLSSKWPSAAYIAYFQSFTNTYAPVDYLRKVFKEALSDPRIKGIAIATRPDCLPDDVLDLLDEINHKHFMWVELGLQSIHKNTQKAMNICYSTEDYDRAVYELSKRNIRYVSHLILGLPGETEEDHQENLSLVETVRFDHMGAFTYSREEDTPSYALEDDVPPEVKEQRKAELMNLQMKIAAEDRKKWIGKTEEVLIEGRDGLTGMYLGRSCLYAPDGVDGMVRFRSNVPHEAGDFAMVTFTKTAGQNLLGEEVEHA